MPPGPDLSAVFVRFEGRRGSRGRSLGFTRVDKRLFHGLDWEHKKFVTAKAVRSCLRLDVARI